MPVTPTALKIETTGAPGRRVAWIRMNRPELRNAFDEVLIAELTQAFEEADRADGVRAIVLAAEGPSFSAGADLKWMKRLGEATPDENFTDARALAGLYRTISTCVRPTLARVHGAAMGGGLGLAAACDICIASTEAFFAASEVRLGIIPAAIGPYLVRAIGERQAYRYFQTAERITASRARELGLVHEAVEPGALDAKVQELLDALLAGSPAAQAAATELIRAVAHRPVDDALVDDTARRIAAIRATPEAREGLSAFLAKRPPDWSA